MAEDRLPVVVGVDGSSPARDALRWAAEDAHRRDRSLRIVHAVEPLGRGVPFYPAPMMMESVEETGRAILAQAIKDVQEWRPGVRVLIALIPDPPAVALRREAENAYEVVVGNRGLGGFTSLLLGSTHGARPKAGAWPWMSPSKRSVRFWRHGRSDTTICAVAVLQGGTEILRRAGAAVLFDVVMDGLDAPGADPPEHPDTHLYLQAAQRLHTPPVRTAVRTCGPGRPR